MLIDKFLIIIIILFFCLKDGYREPREFWSAHDGTVLIVEYSWQGL